MVIKNFSAEPYTMRETDYFIKCENCGEKVVTADNFQKLCERLFKKLARHNISSMEETMCVDSKHQLSMDDMRGAFASETYQVYRATKHEKRPVEWEEAGYGGLKNE